MEDVFHIILCANSHYYLFLFCVAVANRGGSSQTAQWKKYKEREEEKKERESIVFCGIYRSWEIDEPASEMEPRESGKGKRKKEKDKKSKKVIRENSFVNEMIFD